MWKTGCQKIDSKNRSHPLKTVEFASMDWSHKNMIISQQFSIIHDIFFATD